NAVVSLAAPAVRSVEESGGAITVDYLMRDVPETPEAIARLRAKVEGDPQLRGMLVTDDQRAALVVLDFWEGREQSWGIGERAMKHNETFAGRGVRFWLAGEPIAAITDLEQSTMLQRRIPLTFLVIAIMLLVSFRSVQGMLIPMLTATL